MKNKNIEDIVQNFLEAQDNEHEDEWYGTDKAIYTTIMEQFLEYLTDNDIEVAKTTIFKNIKK